ncbi:MAG: tetratricopeptide repeat protein [Termitinemataceae bacterium]|nr:MAG: tetratricopeptide repeat protein [Termitinemataceae bacterium]
MIIPILIVTAIVVSAAFVFWLFVAHINSGKNRLKNRKKPVSKEVLLKEAMKRLGKNPRDLNSLLIVAEDDFEKAQWQKALKTYETMMDIPDKNGDMDQGFLNFRSAACAMNLRMLDVAYKYAAIAHSISPSNGDISMLLGSVEFERQNWEKAIQFLQQSYTINADSAQTLRLLGHTYFKLKRTKEAMTYIRKAIDLDPSDKESLITLAECYEESGQKDQALRIYTHLRPDPVWGPQSCLSSGMSKVENHQDDPAITDFEIGLHHKEIKPEINIELRYQLGAAFLRLQRIGDALRYLSEVERISPGYKDASVLIEKYKELNANKNLQIFIMAPIAEFTALCRKITLGYFPKAKVKITKTQVSGNEWVDIVAEIDTPKWSDIVMFRFIRTQGSIGELTVRDFHSHLKDVKAGKGICIGVGKFSDEAKRFTEARLIDLIDKAHFTPILNGLDADKQA